MREFDSTFSPSTILDTASPDEALSPPIGAASPDEALVSPPIIGDDITTTNECDEVLPSNYFFKGFLAWCLWGWMPILPDSMMKSTLFSDVKCNTSFGRMISLRQAMRSAPPIYATALMDNCKMGFLAKSKSNKIEVENIWKGGR
jgi:hypothetical protein